MSLTNAVVIAVQHDPTVYNAETSSNSVAEEENTVIYNNDGTVATVAVVDSPAPGGLDAGASSLKKNSLIALLGMSLVVLFSNN